MYIANYGQYNYFNEHFCIINISINSLQGVTSEYSRNMLLSNR